MARVGNSYERLRKAEEHRQEPKDESPLNGGMSVETDDADNDDRLPTEFELIDDEITALEEDAVPLDMSDFAANLAKMLPKDTLDDIGAEICDLVEQDIEERAPWRERFERGLEMMGLVESDIDDGPFPGASSVVHPLLVEAVTQFWARAYGELFPPEGPAKSKIFGEQTRDKQARAARVEEYMNYEMTQEDVGYMAEKSRLVWAIPLHGSAFSKTFRDPIFDRNTTIYVPAEDLIVPAEATDLRTAQRFTHRMRKSVNEVRRLMLVGHYRKVSLDRPSTVETDSVKSAKDETQGVAPDDDEKSRPYDILEVCIDINVPGDEHYDANGQETGLERSYLVSIERTSREVLAIYRNWDASDLMCKREVYIEHYTYVPGLGFYGLGLLHLIGGLQTAATGALRVMLDGAASASLSGGFISKNANLKGKRLVSEPGKWTPIDATSEDLQKAFFPLPVKEPSGALFQLLGYLADAGQKFTSTTEVMTGDGDPKGAAVGTTSMMIEQGQKVMSTIHRLIHASLGRELRLRYALCKRWAPQDGYPYDVADQSRTVYRQDFAPGVDIVPVSDPNILSSAQRLAIAQAIYKMAMESGAIPVKLAVRRVLDAMKVPDPDELVPEDPTPQSYDPAGEIQAMLMSKPVLVTPEQPHVAHLQVLTAFASNPQFGGNPQVQKNIGPAMLSCIGQHMAYAWVTHARGLGVPAGYMDPGSGQVTGAGGSPEQIAQALAQIAPHLASAPGFPAPQQAGEAGGKQADQAKAQEIYQKMEMAREGHQTQLQISQDKLAFEKDKNAAKIEADRAKAQSQASVAQSSANAKIEADRMKAQIDAETHQRQAAINEKMANHDMALDMQRSQHEATMGQQDMAAKSAASQQQMAHQQAMGQQKIEHAGQAHAAGMQRSKLDALRQPTGGQPQQPHHQTPNPADPTQGV